MMRPKDAEAITIAVANFKGGVTKTTTAVTLAQGLSLRGHNVLVIDTDHGEGSQPVRPLCIGAVDLDGERTALPTSGEQVPSARHGDRRC